MFEKAKHLLLILALLALSCGPSAEELPRLIDDLGSTEVRVRNKAALEISGMGETGAPAVPALIKMLRDRNDGVRTSAALALRKIGTPEAIAALDSYKR